MNGHDAAWPQNLDDYTTLFRDDFRRRDQARWAAVYLQGLLREGGRVLIGNVVGASAVPARAADARRAAVEARSVLMKQLGLDHFEGRSWRGFHHHACLVMLAYGFRLFQGREGDFPASGGPQPPDLAYCRR